MYVDATQFVCIIACNNPTHTNNTDGVICPTVFVAESEQAAREWLAGQKILRKLYGDKIDQEEDMLFRATRDTCTAYYYWKETMLWREKSS